MEGHLSQGFMEGLDLRGNHHQASILENFPLTMGTLHGGEEEEEEEEEVEVEEEEEEGKKWQRVKWSDKMVKLLITAVSYMGEDPAECGAGSKRKFSALQKKGKWKSVSRAMAERGHRVSPQQCEDKFNDLNKRYKRLNDTLGRGTSCQVVENPALLDLIDFLTEKEKDDVRKILSSKHLFYEEMCSYHNGNRLHLPHDPALQRSLHLDLDLDRHHHHLNRPSPSSRSLHLEERKLQIQAETLDLEKQRLRWERFSKKRDRELDKMRVENQRMKLENDRLALELKRKEMGAIGI